MFHNKIADFFTTSLALLSSGVQIFGIESQDSNPFAHVKDIEVKMDVIRAMEKFQKSPGRIIKTNEVFADFLLNFCDENTLPIFVGGGAHPIALSQDGEEYDQGIKGRIKGAVSVYLIHSDSAPTAEVDVAYENVERQMTGTYDFKFQTNRQALFHDTFDSLDFQGKLNVLTMSLHHLLKGHLYAPKSGTVSLSEDTHAILSAFQNSVGKIIKFPAVIELVTKIITYRDHDEKKKTFFGGPSRHSIYSKELLEIALHKDLKDVLLQEKENTQAPPL
jgi:hypothetical protein